MMPIIGVSFEYALINKLMNGMQNNFQNPQNNTLPRRPEPVKNIVVDKSSNIKPRQQNIINFWDEEEMKKHYGKVANFYGLPKDWQ
jgi:hypothetical protein